MDFKPMKKDGKPDESGHFPWESPGLRARLEEVRKAGKPKTAEGVTPITWGGAASSAGMIARDKAAVTAEPYAESVVRTPSVAALVRLPGYGPWIDWNAKAGKDRPLGMVSVYRLVDQEKQLPVSIGCQNRPAGDIFWDYRVDGEKKPYPGVVVAYCLKESQ